MPVTEKNVPETLFELINRMLLQFSDANLKSDVARSAIANAICNEYYNQLEYNNIGPDEFDFEDDILSIDDTI